MSKELEKEIYAMLRHNKLTLKKREDLIDGLLPLFESKLQETEEEMHGLKSIIESLEDKLQEYEGGNVFMTILDENEELESSLQEVEKENNIIIDKLLKLKSKFRKFKNRTISAYEFHNYKTGHCYVDYIEREGMTEKEGYTRIPLYKV